ncbi:hypothetical protein M3Y94_00420100 [Aphelenchoides besseyi]|nr:hypothetical protein M3Y94_00420100 [Aphelenchoides besseyi]
MPYSYDTSTSQFVNNQRPSTETVNPQNTLTQESQQRCSSPSSNLNGIAQSINSTDEWGDWIDSVLIDQHGDRAREALRKQSHDQPTNAPVQDNSINSNFSVGSSDNRSHERSAVESPQPKKHEERRKRKRSKSRSVERSRSPSLERAKRPCTEADSLNDSSNKTPESSSEANEMETSMSETSTEPMVIETLKKDVELQFVQWHVEEPTVQVQEPLTAARRVESHSSLEEGEIHEDSDEATKTTSQKVIEENVIEISDSDTEETETIESDDDIVFLKEVKADCAPISTHEHVKQEPAPTVEASAQSTIQPSAPSCIESNVEVALEIVRKPILESSFIASAEVSLGIAVEASVDSTVEPALEMPTESNVESHELDITNPNHMAMSEEQSSTLTPANESEESLHLFRYFPEFLDLDGELEQQVSGEEMTTASPLSNIFRNTEIYNENELTDRPIIEEVSLDALSDTEIQWTSEVNSNETQSETQTEVAAHFMDYRVSSYVEFVVPEENNSAVQFNVSAPPRPQPIYLKMPRLAQQEVITLEDDEPIFSHSTSSTSTNVNQRLDLPRNHSRFSPRVQPKVFVSNFVDYRKNSLMSALADKMIVFYDYSEFRSQYADLPIDYWRIDDVCSILLLRTNDPNFVHPNLPISIYRTTTIRYELPPSQSRLSFCFYLR